MENDTWAPISEFDSTENGILGTVFLQFSRKFQNFSSEHNTDWIYREAGLTSLAAFALEIKEKCQRQVGHDRVQIEANEQLDLSKIDPTVAYVQITHVEPSIPAAAGIGTIKAQKMVKNGF